MAKFGKRLAVLSSILLALCVLPILLYVQFGPASGNPVGLGLLMFFGTMAFGPPTIVGLAIWLIGIAIASGKEPEENNAA